jgi:hypothetical protein
MQIYSKKGDSRAFQYFFYSLLRLGSTLSESDGAEEFLFLIQDSQSKATAAICDDGQQLCR